jgi:cell division protein FtsB
MRIPLSTIVITTALVFILGSSSFAQQSASGKLERRIADLEKRIEELEGQVSELRSEVSTLKSQKEKASSITQPSKRPATEKQNWRRLYVGMSMSDVKTLFGDPDNVLGGTYSTTWYYKGAGYSRGWIVFDSNGSVSQWGEPD